ncbi:MAG: S8 family serine peptidase, partial [Thermoanaerobaculales bacterium]
AAGGSAKGGAGALFIDLKAMRFATDDLTRQRMGRRIFLAPDMSSFPPSMVREPFAVGDRDLFIVQAPDPAAQKMLRAWLESSQVSILDFIPELAYLVRLDKRELSRLNARSDVFWAGLFQPAWRIPGKLDYIIEQDPGRRLKLRANFDGFRFRGEDDVLRSLEVVVGLTILRIEPTSRGFTVILEGRADAARLLAALPGCLWVERYVDFQLDNNIARASSNITTGRGAQAGPIMDVEDVWARGIRGEGQIAAAADTGLSTGNLATLHRDYGQQGSGTNPMRVIKGYALGRASTWDDNQTTGGGHGTHTSGSIVGNGVRSGSDPSTNTFPGSCFAGNAPKAQFVFQSIMDSAGNLGGLPADLNNLFAPPYADGARVHSNSWGAPVAGDYTTDSQNLDEFVWNNKDMVITFSAGNSGVDTSPTDGVIDTDNVGAPGTAKNCITIGASEDYRPGFIYEYPAGDCTGNGFTQQAWGWFNGTNFSAAPIYADLMADNANGLGAFSSRGPTNDGRIKPDIVAPGIAVISTRTDVNQAYEQWGVCSIPAAQQTYYMTMGGTSMANPLTAGAAVLVRQYYVDGWHANGSVITNGAAVPADGFQPSAALVKATLINGAWDMNPGQYASPQEIPPGWDSPRDLPNNAEGFGRVDLERSLFPGSGWADDANRVMQVNDVSPGLQTGQNDSFTFNVTSNANPLIVTLVWTDPFGAVSAGTELVNDLDLTVTAPDGTTVYYPNRLNYTGGTADRKNNVEQVKVTSPAVGIWSIDVAGFNVPGNVQAGSTTEPYALVISGITVLCSASAPTGLGAAASGNNAIQLSWSAASGATEYRVYRSTTSGGGYSQVATVTAPATSYLDTNLQGGVTYYYVVTTYDGSQSCESGYSSEASATATGPCDLAPTFAGVDSAAANGCAIDLSWFAATANCGGPVSYSVHRSTTSGFTPLLANRIAAGVSGTSYTDGSGITVGTTYYYVVRATDEANGQEDTNTAEASAATSASANWLDDVEAYATIADAVATGWSHWADQGADDWAVSTSVNHTTGGSNSFTATDVAAVTDKSLQTPAKAVTTTSQLTFWHRYQFEEGSGTTGYDGGVIEISTDGGGSWTDLGPDITAGGYTHTISSTYSNPLGGRQAWSGNQTTFTQVTVDLSSYVGQSVNVRWRMGCDSSVGDGPWYIDDIQITNLSGGGCSSTPSDVACLTGRSTSGQVKLEWVNPSGAYGSTRICRDTAGYPADPAACATVVVDQSGTAGAYDTFTDSGVTNATKYYYAAFVNNGSGVYSGGINAWAYPFATTGKAKWAYSSAASSLAPTGVRPGAIGVGGTWAVSNDRLLHGMNPTSAGGDWPRTAPYSWAPMGMNGPAQARPPVVPTTAVAGASEVIFLGSEDGHAYAADAETGTTLWQSPALGNILLASPSGMFTDFGGSWDLLFIGSRDATADNVMFALDPADGTVNYQFNNGGGANGMGIISSAATVDYGSNRLYFASRMRSGGSSDTLWCLSFDGTSFSKLWSVALGDIDGAPVLYQGRVYVGNTSGTVYAVNPVTGATYWSFAASGDGPVKGFVTPEASATLPRSLYFSTTTRIWSITDNGTTVSPGWNVTSVPGPSIPLAPFGVAVLYAGASDGRLYQLDAATGAVQTSVVLGDGTATIGSPAHDGINNMAYVGSESGAVYGVELPLQ